MSGLSNQMTWALGMAVLACGFGAGCGFAQEAPATQPGVILTPKSGPAPRINGAKVFGVRPGRPFLFTIPATGERPMTFSAENLPAGLSLDSASGQITGTAAKEPGETVVKLHAKNAAGEATEAFKIVVGDTVALTPPMGWNSWNCWAAAVDQDKVLASAKAMVDKGLINHGWTYINIDDTWQGKRGGPFNGIQANEKFPDMKGLADQVHGMGLKIGIYSTPWKTSYAGYIGGSSDDPKGAWDKSMNTKAFRVDGEHLFADNDAKQWGAWGFDYLKYDWNPKSAPVRDFAPFEKQVGDMNEALKNSGRDVVFSYSNSMPFDQIEKVSPMLNLWRTTGDIRDTWWSLTGIGFSQNKWAPIARPGHWNDPDMLVVGYVGWGPKLHPSNLTPDEQYTHISLWSLLSAPLLIGCDMTRLDDFTLSLLTNDEVLAVDQDPLGHSATLVAEDGAKVTVERPGRGNAGHTLSEKQVWAKPLADGSMAVGLFNLGDKEQPVSAKWSDLKVEGNQVVRDLWRQQDVGTMSGEYTASVPSHGVVMVRIHKPE